MDLTLQSYISGVKHGSLDPQEVLFSYLQKAQTHDQYNAFVRFSTEYVQQNFLSLIQKPFCGAPIAVKDIFMTKGVETTCCSAILQGFVPGYSSSAFEKLETAGGCMIGKTNMDEFAMGASNETSYYGPVTNPYDISRTAGGSSGGSAVAVSADFCLGALATDTGGSIRLPASFCGVVGTKATYGRTSRYGVQAMASSLDHIGTITKTVADAVFLLSAISGQDPRDATTIPFTPQEQQDWFDALQSDSAKGVKIAVPNEFFGEGLDPEVKACCLHAIDYLQHQGATIDRIDLPIVSLAVPTYYIITPAEVSTNMARFDGIRYGLQHDMTAHDTVYDYYASIREQGFGDEVKRRILVGAYVLRSGFYDAYYRKALQVRRHMRATIKDIFSQYDAIIGPTSPEVARKIGSKLHDPVKMYLADIYTSIANLVGNPAMSIPCGRAQKDGKSLPVGLQIMSDHRNEATMFGIASLLEKGAIGAYRNN